MDTEHVSCDRVSELLDAYLDGTLTPEETQKVAAHLGNCPECRAAFLLEKQLREDIADAAPEVPASLHGRIMDAVNAEISPKKSRRYHWGRIAGLAATFLCFSLIAVALLSVSMNNRSGDDKEEAYPSKEEQLNAGNPELGEITNGGTYGKPGEDFPNDSADEWPTIPECVTEAESESVSESESDTETSPRDDTEPEVSP